jgi:hypothetical protein
MGGSGLSDRTTRCPTNERLRTEGRKASPLRAASVRLCRGDYFSVPRNATDSFCNLSLNFSDSALEMSIALPSGAVAAIIF